MKTRFTFSALLVALALVFLVSCAGGYGNSSDPTVPLTSDNRTLQYNEAGHFVLAFVQIHYNPEDNSADVIPLRQVAGHWNVLKWLEQGPCTDCVGIAGVVPQPGGSKLWTVEITHPFPLATLTGFDVRGIPMFNGSHTFTTSGLTTPDTPAGDGGLLNADGYTTLYNLTTAGSGPGGLQGYMTGKFGNPVQQPDATLNGYKRHISAGTENVRNAMYAGETVQAEYDIMFPTGGFFFNYCVDGNWSAATTKPVTDPMTDFPPDANCQEPWNIDVDDTPVGGGLTPVGGETVLTMDVYDWQGNNTFNAPVVECPDLFTGALTAAFVSEGTGFATYEVTIENTEGAGAGEYRVLVSVEDQENATSSEWLDLTSYQIYMVEVFAGANDPPVAGGTPGTPNGRPYIPITFYDSSTDPQGDTDIVAYEWDFSYDVGDGFQVDIDQKDPVWQFTEEGTFQIQHRVRDTQSEEDMLDEPIEVTIQRMGYGGTFGSTGSDLCQNIAVSATGEVYLTGTTEGAIDLDPGSGTDTYTSVGDTDFILTKLDADGSQAWGHGWGSSTADTAFDVAISPTGGIYLVGAFNGTVDFDPGGSIQNATANGDKEDAFLLGLNSAGNFVNLDTWGGTSWEGATAIDFDDSDNTYVAGYFYGTVDFNPDGAAISLTSAGGSDCFLMKFSSGGGVDWAIKFGGLQNDMVRGLSVDGMGNCAVVGYFQDTVDFDPGTGMTEYESAGDWDAYIAVFDTTGALTWAGGWGSTGKDQAWSVGNDALAGFAVCGQFVGTVDFDPGTGSDTHTAEGTFADAFLTFFDPTGLYFWTLTWGAADAQDYATDLFIQSFGSPIANIAVTGAFNNTTDMDPTEGEDLRDSIGSTDVYVSMLTTAGEYQFARTWGSTSLDEGRTVGMDIFRNIYVGGNYSATIDLDPSLGIMEFPTLGNYDIFISKLAPDGWW